MKPRTTYTSAKQIISWMSKNLPKLSRIDTNEYLKENTYRINIPLDPSKNPTVSIYGDVNLSKKNLTNIPIEFDLVIGDFNVSNNELVDSFNLPKNVRGTLDCSNNKIDSFDFWGSAEYLILSGNTIEYWPLEELEIPFDFVSHELVWNKKANKQTFFSHCKLWHDGKIFHT